MAASKLADLVSAIQGNTDAYQEYYSSNATLVPDNMSGPSEASLKLPSDIEAARQGARQACIELFEMLSSLSEVVMDAGPSSARAMALDFIYTHKIGYNLKWGEKTTYDELARSHGLNQQDTKRMLRLAMAFLLFDETDDGKVVHTAPSFELATDNGLSAWVGLLTKENWPPMLRISETLAQHPGSEEPLESAYTQAHGLAEPAFKAWEKDEQRIKRFTDGMEYVYSGVGFQPNHLLEDLSPKGSNIPVFVDVGGSKGHVSIALARLHGNWKFIVQDSDETIAVGEQQLPEDLKGKVEFMKHDFFMEQPVKHADVYFFRMIFHDWGDKYGSEILRNLIPACKKGARVIISELCLPPKGAVSMLEERWVRGYDVIMKCFNNGKERDAEDWASLFAKADARFRFLGIRMLPGSKEALIEAEWDP
ncbi:S-adenosyl-L-methionine-dependent methyltransferase [Xylariaceae sp. FL0804]|nr:S-adenosyl-L-methionine-dependent methyltransferase [Xylariaceae sp. FL0804]